MDGGAWWAAVHGVAKSRTWPSDFTFTFHFHALEEEMAAHSSVLAWRIPGTGEPGGLPSTGSHRVGRDWSDSAAAAAAATLSQTLCNVSEVDVTLRGRHTDIPQCSYSSHISCRNDYKLPTIYPNYPLVHQLINRLFERPCLLSFSLL